MSESTVIYSARCPSCAKEGRDRAGDNLKVYDDDHAFCFSCQYRIGSLSAFAARLTPQELRELGLHTECVETQEEGHRMPATAASSDRGNERLRVSGGDERGPLASKSGRSLSASCSYVALNSRGISKETCEFWGYGIRQLDGTKVQAAQFKDDSGTVIAYKARTPDKDFIWFGDSKACGLYGKWLWRDGGKMVVVTEGELDALSVSQAQGNKYPVVSLRNGAANAAKEIEHDLEWLEKFDHVVLWFDNDDPGRKAAEKAAKVLSPGKCKIAFAPEGYKDANDLLKANKVSTIIDAIWGAKEWRPDGIVKPSDLLEEALKPVEYGLPYPWAELTEVTYGIRPREIIGIGAGTGVGKTDFVQEIILHLIHSCGISVGLFFLEESPVLTLKKLAGKLVGKRFHIPNPRGSDVNPLWSPEDLRGAVSRLGDSIRLYDHFGVVDWDVIKGKIRYMAKAEDVEVFVLDNLTALVADAEDERKALEQILADMAGLAQELNVTIFFVSHLATPETGSHEEGARVKIRHFKGSRAIGFWSHFMIGLERDQQAEDEHERNVTTVRILKDRYTGNSLGHTFKLHYDRSTGRLTEETRSPFPQLNEDY